MIANLLVRDHPKKNTLHIENVQIFDDCIKCGEIRRKENKIQVIVKNTCGSVDIIECRCTKSVDHRSLETETELLKILERSKILAIRPGRVR